MSAKLTHSYTAIKKFEQCPLRYYRERVLKDVQDDMGEAAIYGDRIHKALEHRIKTGEMPEETMRFEKLVRAFEALAGDDGQIRAEEEFVITDRLAETDWWSSDAWIRSKFDVLILRGSKAIVGDWKGLALDTPIPTPDGWSSMESLCVGDTVFDAHGKPCRVVGKSAVKNIGCFRVVFDDKTEVVCDEEHLWKTDTGAVLHTPELMGKIGKRQRYNIPRIPVAKPIELPHAALPIEPYVLGLWLADGKHTSGEISKPDAFVWDKVRALGYEVGNDTSSSDGTCQTRTVYGIREHLRALRVLRNKHIPPQYLRASIAQRVELLRGLMDGDGNANPAREQAVFTTCSKQLSDDVCELLASLGQRPNQSTTTQRGFGKTVTAYPIAFRPVGGVNPFSLPRKADRIDAAWGDGFSTFRRAIAVERIPSVPTQCIAVDSPDHTFLCTKRMVPTHNTGARRPDMFQMDMYAAFVMHKYPEVEQVTAALVWLKTGEMDKKTYHRRDCNHLWMDILSRIRRIYDARDADNWPARPSGLCGWCPCRFDCEFATRK